MNAFDSLLPPRLAGPYALPHRGGIDAIRAAAARRRRHQATRAISAGGVASLAFAGLVVLRLPAATHGVDVEPATTSPPKTPGRSQVHQPGTSYGGGVPVTPTAPSRQPVQSPTATPTPRTPTPTVSGPPSTAKPHVPGMR